MKAKVLRGSKCEVPQASAPLGHNMLQHVMDPLGEKGVCVVATRTVSIGEPVLVEAPLLHAPKPSWIYTARLKSFAAYLSGRSESEQRVVSDLLIQKAAVLRAYAEAPHDIREKVRGLQSDFADPASAVAKAVSALADQLHEGGLFSGVGDDHDGLFAGGAALSRNEIAAVISTSIVNGHDFMPEGSEALFFLGCLFEHSCAPNAKMHIVLAPGASIRHGAMDVPHDAWVGEWRATRQIRKGEAVCTSYLQEHWLAHDCHKRREQLLKIMGFVCACLRCSKESSISRDYPDCDRGCVSASWADPLIARTLAVICEV